MNNARRAEPHGVMFFLDLERNPTETAPLFLVRCHLAIRSMLYELLTRGHLIL